MHFNALKFKRLIKIHFIPNQVFPTNSEDVAMVVTERLKDFAIVPWTVSLYLGASSILAALYFISVKSRPRVILSSDLNELGMGTDMRRGRTVTRSCTIDFVTMGGAPWPRDFCRKQKGVWKQSTQ